MSVIAPVTETEATSTRVKSILTRSSLSSLIDKLLTCSIASYDVETQTDKEHSNLEDWHPDSRIVSASWTFDPGVSYVAPFSHPIAPWKDWRKALTYCAKAMAKNENLRIVAHNSKYDIRWTYSLTGYALEDKIWWDTMMADYILDENESHKLKEVVPRLIPELSDWADVNLKDAESVEWEKLALYNARDTDYTLRIVPIQKRELKKEPRLARLYHFIGMPSIRTLTRIERTGLPLDVDRIKTLRAESEEVVEAVESNLLAIATGEYGMDLDDYPTITFTASQAKFFKEFMERSPCPIVRTTDKGNVSWDAEVLDHLQESDVPEVASLGEKLSLIRHHQGQLSKFLVPWLEHLAPDGRLHPTFNPMVTEDKYADKKGTVTGRLSSSNPNAQQIDRNLKTSFAEDGWLFVELDYAQIELRIAAWVFRDQNMLKAIREGVDLHTLFASRITGKTMEEVTPDDRQNAKAGDFGFLFEMSAEGFVHYAKKAYSLDFDIDEAKKIRSMFFKQWPGIERGHAETKTLLFKNGFIRNPIGRKRRLPDIYSTYDYYVGRAERQGINSRIQSMASDLMLLSLIEIDRRANPDRCRLVGSVHDSALAQVRPEYLDESLDLMVGVMLDPPTEKKFGVKVGVPLAVEAKIGYRWNDPEGTTRVYG